MDWRESVVSEELDPRGKSINEIMRWYYTDSLIVNRKYQRKLVWTLKEKQLFIDSIINKYLLHLSFYQPMRVRTSLIK